LRLVVVGYLVNAVNAGEIAGYALVGALVVGKYVGDGVVGSLVGTFVGDNVGVLVVGGDVGF
jgi:hypothetical protein